MGRYLYQQQKAYSFKVFFLSFHIILTNLCQFLNSSGEHWLTCTRWVQNCQLRLLKSKTKIVGSHKNLIFSLICSINGFTYSRLAKKHLWLTLRRPSNFRSQVSRKMYLNPKRVCSMLPCKTCVSFRSLTHLLLLNTN